MEATGKTKLVLGCGSKHAFFSMHGLIIGEKSIL
jgi:hypothetical protein